MMMIACFDHCPVCETARPVRFGPSPAPTSLRELFAWIASAHYAHDDQPQVTLRAYPHPGATPAEDDPLQVQAFIPTLCRRCEARLRAEEASKADDATASDEASAH